MVDAGGPYAKSLGQLVGEMVLYLVDNNEAIKKGRGSYSSTHQKHIEEIDKFMSELESKINEHSHPKPISERMFGHGGATSN